MATKVEEEDGVISDSGVEEGEIPDGGGTVRFSSIVCGCQFKVIDHIVVCVTSVDI